MNAVADLFISKTNGVASVNAGSTTNVYTITVTNSGPSSVTGAILSDPAVAGLSKTAVVCSGTPGQCVTAPTIAQLQSGAFALPTIGNGQAYEILVTTTVTATTGAVANAASVSTPASTLNSGVSCVSGGGITRSFAAPTCTSTDTDSVNAVVDLFVGKSDGVASVNAGGSTVYSITVSNNGPSDVTAATVVDTAPAGLTLGNWTCAVTTAGVGSVTTACGAASGTGNINTTVTLRNGGVITYTVNATVAANATGSIANAAAVAPPGGTTNSGLSCSSGGGITRSYAAPTCTSTDTNTVNLIADLAVTKTDGVATVNAGGTTTYTVTLTNNGPSAANNTTISDPAVAGLSKTVLGACTVGGGATCPTAGAGVGQLSIANLEAGSVVVPNLPNGGSISFTISASVTANSGTVANTFSATPPMGTTDPTPANASATDTDTVITPDLTLTKASASTFVVGGQASFTLTASNALGTAPTVGNIVVTDTLPSSLTYVPAGSGGAGWVCSNVAQTVTCTSAAVLAAGAAATPITINVSIGSTAVPSVTNTASVSGGGELAVNTGNNSATLMVPVSGAVTNTFLTDGAQTGLPGTSLLYTHVFTSGSAGNVSFTSTNTPNPVVAGWGVQIYRDTNCNGMLDGSEGGTEITGAAIAVAAAGQVCIIVKSNIPLTAPYNAVNVIAVTANFVPTVGASVSYVRQDVTTVGAAGGAGLVLSKSVRNVTQGGVAGTNNSAKPGDVLEYVVTYMNNAASPVTTIVISDNTPAFTNFANASCGAPLPTAITACNVTTQPSVGGAGNIQWTLTGSLNSTQTGNVIFRVVVQ